MRDKQTVGLAELESCLVSLEELFEENKSRLGKLDSQIGDGDHGESMARGFKTAAEAIEGENFEDISSLFNSVGRALITGIGGAAGPIFGSLFLGMANGGAEELDTQDLASRLRDGLEQVKKRGKAEPGDKTMVDALQPAVEGFEKAADDGASLCSALIKATEKAEAGMERTRELKSKKGRSSFTSERSKGHQDPGATSIYLIIDHLWSSLCGGN